MRIGIIVAMDKEYQQLRPLFPEDRVILQKSGIGKVNAALQTAEMIRQYKPDCIISSGCAGGNGDDINVQDVVVSTQLAYHDVYCGTAVGISVYGQVQGLPERFEADAHLLEKAREIRNEELGMRNDDYLASREADRQQNSQHLDQQSNQHSSFLIPNSSFKIHPGLIVTGDWFVDSKEKMREIIGHFPEAKAVDMESAAIAQTCYIYKVPFISFRVISDLPLRDTKASQYHNFWDTIAEHSFQVTKAFVQSL